MAMILIGSFLGEGDEAQPLLTLTLLDIWGSAAQCAAVYYA
jgi:hypothetical protein